MPKMTHGRRTNASRNNEPPPSSGPSAPHENVVWAQNAAKDEASNGQLRTVGSRDSSSGLVLFYGPGQPFSNFTWCLFTVAGVEFCCTEQYFHYKKAEEFGDVDSMRILLATKEPRKQKQLGRLVQNFDQARWENVCERHMKDGCYAKFDQNAELRRRLLETIGSTLVEASPRDRKWGIGLGKDNPRAWQRSEWRGRNLLGRVLMKVRDELLKKELKYAEDIQLRRRCAPDGPVVLLFYGWTPVFSNFCRSPFVVDGLNFSSNEQFYQYQKAKHFKDERTMKLILDCTDPSDVKRLAVNIKGKVAEEWNSVCEQYMYQGCLAKFEQNYGMRQQLVATVGVTLAEASPRDDKWGIGMLATDEFAADESRWKGRNLLGRILMNVRDHLLQPPQQPFEAASS